MLRGVPQRLIDAREVDIFLFAAREFHVFDALQGHADQHLEGLALGLDERLDGRIARDEVREDRRGKQQ